MEHFSGDFCPFLHQVETNPDASPTEYNDFCFGDQGQQWNAAYEAQNDLNCLSYMQAVPMQARCWNTDEAFCMRCGCSQRFSMQMALADCPGFVPWGGSSCWFVTATTAAAGRKKRIVWTSHMEQIFREALVLLGDKATAKPILEYLLSCGITHLTRVQVGSHLQKYREKMKRNWLA